MSSDRISYVDSPNIDGADRLPADPMAALDKLTQLDIPSATTAANACGAVSLVAASIATRGYVGIAQLADRLQGELSEDHAVEIRCLAEEVAGAEGTYGVLAGIAEIIQRRYRGFDGGMPYDKLLHLMKLCELQPPSVIDDGDIGRTVARAGQCWPAKIAVDDGDDGDHWILVGRCLRGGLFLYDPWPRADGSQIIRPAEDDWRRYAEAIAEKERGQETIGFLPTG